MADSEHLGETDISAVFSVVAPQNETSSAGTKSAHCRLRKELGIDPTLVLLWASDIIRYQSCVQ
jgi:hypothetical protein